MKHKGVPAIWITLPENQERRIDFQERRTSVNHGNTSGSHANEKPDLPPVNAGYLSFVPAQIRGEKHPVGVHLMKHSVSQSQN
jgi:hypothetical protein